MVQTMKEYQKEYFEKEGYTIIDNMENAINAFCERYPQHTNVAEESILNDTNCDWVVLNDGSVAVLPGILEKTSVRSVGILRRQCVYACFKSE